ncbi:PhzF family phenazine biosynthesis protein [Ruminococcus sp. OA3]|uniref:PhzF family phenazine biosynthesis protein n=1 Tax=Ruminococcus sp. OA3 TaxID=2914164 RepID=UPI001F0678A1|nr:PhzF family phenazine biosynthesis protein [Ruminococcus sp. OA3]MCH1984078.1 PhzF family phenazine biosynthesis protein [Ruminococcus sp. OA3]
MAETQREFAYWNVRWFTPAFEINLCGHATLAAAFVVFNYIGKTISQISFETVSGILNVSKQK